MYRGATAAAVVVVVMAEDVVGSIIRLTALAGIFSTRIPIR
jgi:hypothetical protein